MCLCLFPRIKALKIYDINLRFHTRDSDKNVNFINFFIVILYHKRVIWNTLIKISNIDQKCIERHILIIINFIKSI